MCMRPGEWRTRPRWLLEAEASAETLDDDWGGLQEYRTSRRRNALVGIPCSNDWSLLRYFTLLVLPFNISVYCFWSYHFYKLVINNGWLRLLTVTPVSLIIGRWWSPKSTTSGQSSRLSRGCEVEFSLKTTQWSEHCPNQILKEIGSKNAHAEPSLD